MHAGERKARREDWGRSAECESTTEAGVWSAPLPATAALVVVVEVVVVRFLGRVDRCMYVLQGSAYGSFSQCFVAVHCCDSVIVFGANVEVASMYACAIAA